MPRNELIVRLKALRGEQKPDRTLIESVLASRLDRHREDGTWVSFDDLGGGELGGRLAAGDEDGWRARFSRQRITEW